MKRIAITGSSGFLGTRLIRQLRQYDGQLQILGLDLNSADDDRPDEFIKLDIRDKTIVDELVRFNPDAIIHLAFVLNPIRNEHKARKINLGGFSNVLQAVSRTQTKHLMIVSSATAYGAHAEYRQPYSESESLKGHHKLRYAADKVQIEELIKQFSVQYPSVLVNSIRPCLIGGQGADNFIIRYLVNMPFLILIDGQDLPLQFAHVSDVARGMSEILYAGLSGPFNIAPQDKMTLSQIAQRLNKPTRSLPYWLVRSMTALAWHSRLPFFEVSPGFVPYSRYPWLVDSTRLRRECQFVFEYDSKGTFEASLPKRFYPQT